MTKAGNPLVRPEFYDVLSGEFLPQTDPARKRHTLGRLAVATYRRGERIQLVSDLTTPGTVTMLYDPSWATHTQVVTNWETVNRRWLRSRGDLELRSVQISDTFGNLFAVRYFPDSETVSFQGADPVVQSRPANIGEDLDATRTELTTAAQAFFDHSTEMLLRYARPE